MALTRFPDWPTRLHAFLSARRRTPFAWGSHDCALFACDGVREMTGVDLAAGFRGGYDSEAEAMTAIGAFTNGGTLEDLAVIIAGEQGIEENAPAFAQRGDVALMPGPTLGLVSGAQVACCQAPAGVGLVPLAAALRTWRI